MRTPPRFKTQAPKPTDAAPVAGRPTEYYPPSSLADDQARRRQREALNQRTPVQRIRDMAQIVTTAGNTVVNRVRKIKRFTGGG